MMLIHEINVRLVIINRIETSMKETSAEINKLIIDTRFEILYLRWTRICQQKAHQ